jgi:hypothetical protein
VDGSVEAGALPRQVYQRSVVRERELSGAVERVRRYAFEGGNGRTGHLQTLEIEGRGEERPLVHVSQVAARKIAAVVPAALQDLPCACWQRLHDEVRVLETGSAVVTRVEHRLASGQRLRPPLRLLAWVEWREGLRCPACRGDSAQAQADSGFGQKEDRSVLSPGPPTTGRGVAERDGSAPGDRDLLQLAAGEKADPLAVGGEEWAHGIFGSRESRSRELIEPPDVKLSWPARDLCPDESEDRAIR